MEHHIKALISADPDRMQALQVAADLALPDWCLAAGFVRNCLWDYLHGYQTPTPLNDIDFIFFDPQNCDEITEKKYERQLFAGFKGPWSVKNQARMHLVNGDPPYSSTADAMSFWVETETALGVFLDAHQQLQLVAPLGLPDLQAPTVTLNPKRPKPAAFRRRLYEKKWQAHWPELRIEE